MLAPFPSNPAPGQLRQFGYLCLAVLPLAAWLLGAGPWVLSACGILGLGAALAGRLRPAWLRLPFLALMCLAWPVGLALGELILLLLYFGVLLPIGLAFRLAGRDPLDRRLDRGRASYWTGKEIPDQPLQYYRPW